ncbi:hypothetical protein CEV31_0395 [Brucella thiophenivorans]|uniref:Uncharacterized protein n=1 Tax=Brucella thiophenivorans TaxID=571255 RepID=A0A256G4Z9_9HYPH|nr:hypothetical protein CEV31_0395 [Brucella thiophenivorans]
MRADAVHHPGKTLPVNHKLRTTSTANRFVTKLSHILHVSAARLDFEGIQAHIL